jgi:hypothetical protein
MACALDVTGLVPTAKANAQVTVKLIAATTTIQSASVNTTDVTNNIDATGTSVSFTVSVGTNTVILVLFPPPAAETMDLVEDCGDGTTQLILSFASGIRADITFDIIAS